MKDTPGSTNLTPEQQDYYQRRFGVRYVAVQEQPFFIDEHGKAVLRASRKERRARRNEKQATTKRRSKR